MILAGFGRHGFRSENLGVDIKVVFKVSLIDFPGKIASVVFLSQCNFRCPYCHNPELLQGFEKLPSIPEKEILDFLQSKKGWLDGVVVTGGEPTLQASLPEFLRQLKKAGWLVKLDTNGSNPLMLKKLLAEKLLDFIAMDVKAPLAKYEKATGVKVNLNAIQESVKLVQESGLAYEFRLTVVPKIFEEKDCQALGAWLQGSKKFVLQQFNPEHQVLDSAFQNLKPFSPEELKSFAEKLKPFFGLVELRGV